MRARSSPRLVTYYYCPVIGCKESKCIARHPDMRPAVAVKQSTVRLIERLPKSARDVYHESIAANMTHEEALDLAKLTMLGSRAQFPGRN